MSNPRIEEVSNDASDPDEQELDDDAFDFAKPKGSLAPAMDPSASQMSPEVMEALMSQQNQPQSQQGQRPQQMSHEDIKRLQREQQQKSKHYQSIYPVYFDASRSREDGRRVGKAKAVANPLARDIVSALEEIGGRESIPFQVVFEPSKTHPKDWANPGRVKVLVKQDGKPVSRKVQNKHHLYTMIAEYLRQHPTTDDSPLELRLQGLPPPKDGKAPKPAIPRGFKMGTVLPLHSPAVSGGGVSDNFLKDMMDGMGGQLPPGMEGMANMLGGAGGGGGAAPSKEPKKVKKGKK